MECNHFLQHWVQCVAFRATMNKVTKSVDMAPQNCTVYLLLPENGMKTYKTEGTSSTYGGTDEHKQTLVGEDILEY